MCLDFVVREHRVPAMKDSENPARQTRTRSLRAVLALLIMLTAVLVSVGPVRSCDNACNGSARKALSLTQRSWGSF